MMHAPSQRLQSMRALLAILLWTAALIVVAIVLLGHRDPIAVSDVVGSVITVAWRGAIVAAVAAVIAALLWPPFLPWLRVRWQQIHENVEHNAQAVHEAVARLQHFENGPDRITLGKELLAQHDFARAVPHLARAVELEPDSLTARQLLGRALQGVGQVDQAAQMLGDVVRRDEDHAFGDSLRAYGEVLAAAEKDDEAERVLARHEARFGPSRSVDVLRADLAKRRGDHARAKELLRRAAAKPSGERKLTADEALARGRARVRLWFGGGAA